MLAYSKMGRKKGARKTRATGGSATALNTGAKARAKDRSTAVSQNVKVSIGASRKQPLRGRLGSRPSYTMPSFGGGGSASVSVTVPHSLPSFDQQMGYSIHTLSSNVDNLVRYLQQTQGAQPIPGPSSEALARSAVLSTATTGTQTEVATDPPPFEGTDSGPQPTSVGSASSRVEDSNGSSPSQPPGGTTESGSSSSATHRDRTQSDSMLGQSQQAGADPLRFNVGARSRQLPPRTPALKRKSDGTHEGLTGDVVRPEFPLERRGVKRKSGGTHEGLTGDVFRTEFPEERRGVKRKSGGTHEGLTGDVVRPEFPLERRGVKRKSGGTHEGLTGDVVRPEFPLERRGVKRKSGGTHEGLTGDVFRTEFPEERRGVKRKSGGTQEGLTGDVFRKEFPLERRGVKRKSGSDHYGLTATVGRPEYSGTPAQAPNGVGPRRPHAFEGLAGRYPFVYPRQHRFSAQEAVPMGGFNFADNERPMAKRKRDESFGPGSGSAGFHGGLGVGGQKMQRIGTGRLRF